MSHNSGLRNYELDLDKIDTPQISDEQVLWLAQQQNATDFPPGSRYEYSDGAYCLLALAVARISGMDFGDYLQGKIFAPAGMVDARLNTASDIPRRVYGCSHDPAQGWIPHDQSKTSATCGDGGIYASAEDLMKWQRSLYGGAILSPQSLALMTSPHMPRDTPEEIYGFGLVIDRVAGQKCYRHTGESAGFRNALYYFPTQDLSLALLSNQDVIDINAVGKSLLETDFFGQLQPGYPENSPSP